MAPRSHHRLRDLANFARDRDRVTDTALSRALVNGKRRKTQPLDSEEHFHLISVSTPSRFLTSHGRRDFGDVVLFTVATTISAERTR
ncbi:hypothetical protein TIFTF001_031391 [Ficus carica]|uniref:Uncharacterized protein n=1 Tax=Ficus carica TaxID=3494 RepID=A0AA88E151_FICCA|nr:hypothetical protein TIFTF001_031391 [Ficus carica]